MPAARCPLIVLSGAPVRVWPMRDAAIVISRSGGAAAGWFNGCCGACLRAKAIARRKMGLLGARRGDCSTRDGFAATVSVWGLASSGIGLSRRRALCGKCAVWAVRGHESVNDARVQRIKRGQKKIAGRRPRARGTISSLPAGLHRDSAYFALPGYCLATGFRRSGVCCDLLILVTGLPSDVGRCWRRGSSGPNGPRMRQP